VLAVVGLLGLAGAAPARADVFDDNPATTSRGPGDIFVFARAANGATLERHRKNGGWTDWSSLGGTATSGPAAVVYGGNVYVFVRGGNGAIWRTYLDGGHWMPWLSLGGFSTSAPAVAARRGGGNELDLVIRGADNQLYHQAFTPSAGWSGFATIGGQLTSAASVNSQAPGLLNIWARGTDGQVYQKSWTSTRGWIDWASIGGGIIGAPTSVSRQENTINVYARGAGNALYQRSWTGSWGEWFLLDSTAMDSSPAAAGEGPNREWVFARRGGNLIFKEWTSTRGWSDFGDFGPVAVPEPAPPTPSGPPATTPIPDGKVNLTAGVACTPVNGKLRVSVSIAKPKGKARPRVTKIVFYTKGKGRRVRVDTKAPFQVHIGINRPAGSTSRVYARVYYKRTAGGKTYRKVVSRRYKVCR
jgi:hypothetical protein